MLFKSLSRSKLDYNNTVWWCSTKAEEQKFEAVQRQATKMSPGITNLGSG